MASSDHVPFMQPGISRRNVAVAVTYFLLSPILLPMVPFYLLVAIGTNYQGLSDLVADSRLGDVPPIDRGGWPAGIAVFTASLLIVVVFFSLLASGGGGSGTESPLGTESPSEDDPSPGTATAVIGEPGPNTPTSTPVPMRTEYNVSGPDDGLSDPFAVAPEWGGEFVSIQIEHDGDGAFVVDVVELDGTRVDRIVDAEGTYDGTVGLFVPHGEYALEVTANGEWSGRVRKPQFTQGDVLAPPFSSNGTNHGWVGPLSVDVNRSIDVLVSTNGTGQVDVRVADVRGRILEDLANVSAGRTVQETFHNRKSKRIQILLLVDAAEARWSMDVGPN